MGISLGAVEPWAVAEQLPPDTYLFTPAPDGVERDTINDSEKVKVNWRVAGGPYTGAERNDWVTVSERAMGRVKQLIVAAGIKEPAEDFDSYKAVADWLADELRKGVMVGGVVRLKEDRQGRVNDDGSVKMWPEIVGYVPAKEAGVTAAPMATASNGGGAAKPKDDSLPFRAEPVPSFEALKSHEARSL